MGTKQVRRLNDAVKPMAQRDLRTGRPAPPTPAPTGWRKLVETFRRLRRRLMGNAIRGARR